MKNIIFKACSFDFEEGYNLIVYEENDCFFISIKGHNVLSGDYEDIYEVTEEEAIEIMIEEEENEDHYEEM